MLPSKNHVTNIKDLLLTSRIESSILSSALKLDNHLLKLINNS